MSETEGNEPPASESPRSGLSLGHRLVLLLPDLRKDRSTKTAPAPKLPAATRATPTKKRSSLDDAVLPHAQLVQSTGRPVVASTSTRGKPATNGNDAETDTDADADEASVAGGELDKLDADTSTGEESETGATANANTRRGSTTARPVAPSQYDSTSNADLLKLVRNLDDRERKLAFLCTPLGIILAGVSTYISYTHNPALHHKNHVAPSEIVTNGLVAVVLALIVFGVAWFRKRSLTTFALLFLGYSVGLLGVGLPFVFFGGYVMYRGWKIQKVLTARGINPRARQGAKSRAPGKDGSATARGAKATKTSAPSKPVQSKRYTPPKPPPKRPPAPKPERASNPDR